MILLLDTNAFIWSLALPERLGRRAVADISDNKNQIYISNVSMLECAIKIRTGKLKLSLDFSRIENYLNESNMHLIPFDAWAAEHYINLPRLSWSDPFDGAIIAQAISKQITLITSDSNILSSNLDNLKTMDARS